MTQQMGQFLQADFFQNVGGLNLTDSPFAIKNEQSIGGFNYDYVKTGGITKSLSPIKLNAIADSQLKSLGIGLHNTKASIKTIIRAAGTKIQSVTMDGVFVDLSDDTSTAGTNFLPGTSSIPVVMQMFVTPSTDILWLAGGGLGIPRGVYSSTKVTENGTEAPQGSISATTTGGGGNWATPGTFFYAVSFSKASTGAESNASLDVMATVTLVTDTVTIDFTGITNNDTTLYDTITLYRSAISGVTEFTTGDIIAILPSTTASFSDTGDIIVDPAVNVPRPGNQLLDNSELPAGTYNMLTSFKHRLITAKESTVYLSDINKPESWPLNATIDIPSGGKITALGVVSYATPTNATGVDDLLAVWKENELWVITGSTPEDVALQFIDHSGCSGANIPVNANGYIYWMDQRGIYLWDGAGKPVYISRTIEYLYSVNGHIDKIKLPEAFGRFYKKQNQVIWTLSSTLYGEMQYTLKLDLRLTLPRVSNTLGERILDGIFSQGKTTAANYSGDTFIMPLTIFQQEEVFISGDDAGFVYRQFYDNASTGNDVDFSYESRFLDMESPGKAKQFHKVIAWVDNVGDWELVLDFWGDYRNNNTQFSTIPAKIPGQDHGDALWDVAFWDVASWDDFSPRPKALIFNLHSTKNNSQGDAIKLRFRNAHTNQPITINGFSVVYSEISLRK